MGEPAFPQEFDWCLHLWQKKMPETVSSIDEALLEASRVRYVNARYGSAGIPCLQEQLLLRQYCEALDDHSNSGGNHADLIMPAIKNAATDCLKWEHCSSDSLMAAMETARADPLEHSPSLSPEELKELAVAFAGSATEACNVSKASDESKENSHVDANITSSSPVRGISSNQTAPSNTNCSIAVTAADISRTTINQGSLGSDSGRLRTSSGVTELRQNMSSAQRITSIPGSLDSDSGQLHTSSGVTDRNIPSFHRTPKATSFDLIGSSNADLFGSGALQPRPLQNLPRNAEHFGARQSNNAGRGRGFYPWQKKAESSGPGAKKEADFRTASYQLRLNQAKQGGRGNLQESHHAFSGAQDDGAYGNSGHVSADLYGNTERRSLGTRPGSVTSRFVPPVRRQNSDGDSANRRGAPAAYGDGEGNAEPSPYEHMMADVRLKNIESKMVEQIMNEVLDVGVEVQWDHIAGLQDAKATIQEVVVWPMLRPDIFTGLRGPPKGVLLFGPPGTGKTMIGKAIASQSGATFFSISASCLTSKWVGEGEKMVRALFAVARVKSPSVIFIDEVDSLLCQRSDTEHESSRRIKTEFLVQLDGVGALTEQVLVVGATNRPQELDEAARRRLVKRLYIPLPDLQARRELVEVLLSRQQHTLQAEDLAWVARNTEGFSGADIASLCSEAAMGPVRDIDPGHMRHVTLDQVRPINVKDFRNSVKSVRPSVCQEDLLLYTEWNAKYGITRALGH